MLSDQLIAKRGPLARVWLASHWERKISKSQFLQTNLEKTIDAIATKEQELLTLRISGQLLLGVVRIYSRKTRYLLEDCNEALVKIKLAFKKGDVNMPDIHHSVASLKSITLPEKLTEFDILLPDEPFADIDIDPKDPMFDSLSQLASSQDITLSDFDGLSQIAPRQDITLGGTQELDDGFAHINHGQVEQGMSFMEAEYGHVDDLEIGFDLDIENPRRDNDPELSAQFEDSFDRMSIKDNQQHDQQQFDPDFGVDYDFGDYDLNPADDVRPEDNAETFDQRAVDPMGSSQSTLMQSGVVPDFDDNMLFEETQMAEAPAPVRRRRRLIVDRVTEIPHEECRRMFNDSSAIVNRNINRRTAAKKKQQKIDWTKPAASPEGSSLFQIMNRKRAAGTLDEPMSPKEPRLDGQDEMTVADEPAQPVTENNEERDNNATAGGPDMDFDLDFGPDNWDDSVPIDPQGDAANPEEPLDEGAANMSIYSQSSQSTIGQNSRETLELIQTKAAGAGNTKFQDIAPSSCTKSEAAKKFYSVLLLTTKRMVKVHQQRPFGDIQISL